MSSQLHDSVVEHSNQWAIKRKFYYKKKNKKVTFANLATEIVIAKTLGYLDSAEHLLKAIVKNPDWTREDIEAELHLYIQNLSNIAEESLGQEKSIDLDFILNEYDYYKKDEDERVTTSD